MEGETRDDGHHMINNITRTFDYINNNCHNNDNNNNWNNVSNFKNVSIEIFEDPDSNFCQVFGQDLYSNTTSKNEHDFHERGSDNPGFKLPICKSLCELERNLNTGSDEAAQLGNKPSKLKAHVCFCSQCGLGPEYLQFVKKIMFYERKNALKII
jgi:hypothetical protein